MKENVRVFDDPVRYYADYSHILTNYKQTKFMISLYGEIKSYVARIRSYLNKELESMAQSNSTKNARLISENTMLIVSYLLVF